MGSSSRAKQVGAFLVPILAVAALLYQGLVGLRITLTQPDSLIVLGAGLAIGVVAGLLAAVGGDWTRVLVLGATTVLLVDMTVHPSRLFDAMTPLHRLAPQRDADRVVELQRIRDALEAYIRDVGPLPSPAAYGEGTGPETFWAGWWDVSSTDGDGDGRYFLDFLEEHGGSGVPLDPLNVAPDPTDPRSGTQYVYFVVPPGYGYQGGVCPAWKDRSVYLLAISAFETAQPSIPETGRASSCDCLWRDKPGFFAEYFDYMLCGTFSAS